MLVVAAPRFDVQGATVQREHPAVVAELVALGVPAEVVVVIENQDFRASTDVTKKVVRGGQPTQTAAHDHQVVGFIQAGRARQIHLASIAKLMSDFERSRMTPAHANARRRVIVWRALRRELLLGCSQQLRRQRGTDNAQSHAVQEIAASDALVHPERTVVRIHGSLSQCVNDRSASGIAAFAIRRLHRWRGAPCRWPPQKLNRAPSCTWRGG